MNQNLKIDESLRINEFKLLQKLNVISNDVLYQILGDNGAANLTVCPHCHEQDFGHAALCPLLMPHAEYEALLAVKRQHIVKE